MINANSFAAADEKGRREWYDGGLEKTDRPLIVQFAATNPKDFIGAALLVQSTCDAVDLNLGFFSQELKFSVNASETRMSSKLCGEGRLWCIFGQISRSIFFQNIHLSL